MKPIKLMVLFVLINKIIAFGQCNPVPVITENHNTQGVYCFYVNGATPLSWDMGNGNTNGAVASCCETFAPGSYTVIAFFHDSTTNTNCSANITINVTYTQINCNGAVNVTDLGNGTYQFEYTANLPAGSVYNWNFSDGSFASGNPVVHTFTIDGQRYVFISTSYNGASACYSSVDVVVTGTGNCHLNMAGVESANGYWQFYESDNYLNNNNTYNWNFGDGNTLNNSGNSPAHTYLQNGQYTVHVEAVNNGSVVCTGDTVINVTSINFNCNINYTYNIVDDSVVYFQTNVNPMINNAILYWDFGDGTSGYSSTDQSQVNHNYHSNQVYNVQVSYIDQNTNAVLCVYNQLITISTINDTCSADFYMVPDSANFQNVYVYFQQPMDPAVQYLWDFGDGTGSTLAQPSHSYSTPGNYTVCLTTTNPNYNCTASDCDSGYYENTRMQMQAFSYIEVKGYPVLTGLSSNTAATNITLYPNPSLAKFMVDLESGEDGDVLVYSFDGKLITTYKLEMGKAEIDLTNFSAGIYSVNVKTATGVYGKRIIKL